MLSSLSVSGPGQSGTGLFHEATYFVCLATPCDTVAREKMHRIRSTAWAVVDDQGEQRFRSGGRYHVCRSIL